MAELAALNIKITGDSGDLKAAVTTATGDLARLSTAAKSTGANVASLAPKMANVGVAAGNSSQALRNASFQLSQVGQQTMATGNFVQALAIQLPDLGLAFGAAGAAAGLLAGIALPLVISAFSSTSDSATSAKTAIDAMKESTLKARDELMGIQLGLVTQEQIDLQKEIMRLTEEKWRFEAQAADEADAVVKQYNYNQAKAAQEQIDLARQKLAEDQKVRQQIAIARMEQEAHTKSMRDTNTVAGQLADTTRGIATVVSQIASADLASVFASADAAAGGLLSRASAVAAKMGEVLSANAALRQMETQGLAAQYAQYGAGRVAGERAAKESGALYGGNSVLGSVGGGVGGGGGTANQLATELESLQRSLASQEQLQLESYQRQQETLQQALQQRLITQEEYSAMMQASAQQHSDAMTAIDVYRYGNTLDKSAAFFGDMADAFANGNDKMLKISKAFGAAQALISAWQGAAEALKLPFPGNLAAFAKVLATGFGAVNAIKSVGKGGTGGTAAKSTVSSAATTTSNSNAGTYMNFQFSGGWSSTEQMGRFMVNAINQAIENGATIKGARIV